MSASGPRRPWLAFVGPAALVAVWAVVASAGLFPAALFPHPLAVARGLAAHLGDGYPEMQGFLKRTAEPTAPAACV